MNEEKKTKKITPEQFARIWNGAKDIDEVALLTGLTENAAYQRATRYRNEHGADLKSMGRRGRPSLDVESLRLAAKASRRSRKEAKMALGKKVA